jgi:spermidine synthase
VAKLRWYFGFFLLSGFCSLVYEVVWLRLAMAKFGVTTPMVSIVLSVFMAGLGLGSWGGGAFARRFERSGAGTALRLYGSAELLIGVSGLLVPQLINFGHDIVSNTGRGLAWDSSTYYLASGGWVAISLIPWCTCMGATFPFAMAAIRKSVGAESQHSFSYLYLANVLGAILGTLVPAYVLIELLGFKGTLHVAGLLNGILAATVFALSLGPWTSCNGSVTVSREKVQEKLRELPRRGILWLLFTTGLCSMAMEVIWIRQFAGYLGNVVYALAAILALYLGATFSGARVYRLWLRSRDPQQSAPAWILLGLLALLPLVFADPALPIPTLTHQSSFTLGATRVALGIVPFSGLLGFLTPMLVDRWSLGDPDRAGRAYAVNVVGSIIGPLLAGFWILPWFGDRWGLCAMSLPLFVIGLLAALGGAPLRGVARPKLAAKGLYAGVILASLYLLVVARGYEARYVHRVERRDYTATVIATGEGMRKDLVVNGIGMTFLTPITKTMAHLPLAFLSRPPRRGLVICFGMGTTFRSMLSWGIHTTAVELVPSVPSVFGYYHPDGPELLKSPLAQVVVDDGRRFLERSTEQYDVITLDPPPPVGAPTSSLLYSREFYTIAKRHLRPGGILQAWLPGGDAGTRASAAKALQDSFPHVRAFGSIEGWGIHFLAGNEPFSPRSAADLARYLPASAAADFVEWGPATTAEGMFEDILQQEQSLEAIIAADRRVPPIDDDQPINEYFLLRRTFHCYR